MPFKSEAQRKFLFLKHPDIAKRWAKEYPNQGKLPKHVKKKKKSQPGDLYNKFKKKHAKNK